MSRHLSRGRVAKRDWPRAGFRCLRMRRGAETLELILVLPLLFMTLVAGVQFSSVMAVDTTFSSATIEASRLAAMGCRGATLGIRVDEFLAIHGMALGPGSRLVVEDSTGAVESFGDGTLTSPTIGSPLPAESVRSTLLIATAATPLPNALRQFNIDFSGRQFEHVAIACLPAVDCP